MSAPRPPAEATLLQLMWLASPALPVGGFSYSEGLEAAVDAGRVHDAASAASWLLHQLELNLVRSDLPACAQAHGLWLAPEPDTAALQALNTWVLATRETSELRLQTEQMGRSLAEWLRQLSPASGTPAAEADLRLQRLATLGPAPTWPVAFALAAARGGADAPHTLLAYAFGWAENMAQAAIKAVPLGQAAAQRVLAQLVQAIPAACQRAGQTTPAQRQAFSPLLAILSARHEAQYSRLFRS